MKTLIKKISDIKKENSNKKKLIWIAIIFFVFILCLWKSKYGSGKKDEALYLLIPYRLIQGDALLVDEWHLSQLFSFIMYPILKLYLYIAGSFDGIVIAFRYLYTFIQLLVSIFIYFRLKKYDEDAAIISSIVYMLYSPFNITALNYNTICVIGLVVSLIILISYNKKYELIMAGFFFAMSVLCNPYLIVIYFIYLILVIINKIKHLYTNPLFEFSDFALFSVGAICLAIPFVLFVFSRTSIEEILKSIPYILNDSQYQKMPLYVDILNFFKNIICFSKVTIVIYILYFMSFIIMDVKKEKKNILINIPFAITFIYFVYLVIVSKQINLIILPLNIASFFVYYIYWDKKYNNFLIYLIPAYLYMLFIHLSSDTGIEAISSASIVCLLINIVLLVKYIKTENIKVITKKVLISLIAFFVCVLSFYKVYYVYNKQTTHIQYNKITYGPYNGIYVNDDFYGNYVREYDEMETLKKDYNDGNILILSDDLWMYLFVDKYKTSAHSIWRTRLYNLSNCIEELNVYYEMNPYKIPDIIYVDKDYIEAAKGLNIINDYIVKETVNNRLVYSKK